MGATSSWALLLRMVERNRRKPAPTKAAGRRRLKATPAMAPARAMRWTAVRGACLFIALLVVGLPALTRAANGAGQSAPPRSDAIPRTRDGKPDFTGVWQAMNSAAWNIQDHVAEKGVPAGRGVV